MPTPPCPNCHKNDPVYRDALNVSCAVCGTTYDAESGAIYLPMAFPSSAGPISWLFENGDANVMDQSTAAWASLTDVERAEIRVMVNASRDALKNR